MGEIIMRIIHTTFLVGKKDRYIPSSTKLQDGFVTMKELAEEIICTTWNTLTPDMQQSITRTDFIRKSKDTAREYIFIDKKETTYSVLGNEFDAREKEGISFVIADVKEINYFTKQTVYFYCEYIDEINRVRQASFCTPANRMTEKYTTYEGENYILIGMVKRKQKKMPVGYGSNKYKKAMAYNIKTVNMLKNFCILRISEKGLYSKNRMEQLFINRAQDKGEIFYREGTSYALILNRKNKSYTIQESNGQFKIRQKEEKEDDTC